jgi:hypothetical protein
MGERREAGGGGRRLGLVSTVIAVIGTTSMAAQAESDAGCMALTRFGVYDKFATFTPETQYELIQSFFANNPCYSRRDVERQREAAGSGKKGLITMRPETVADTCRPRRIIGEEIDLGRGVSVSCKLPPDAHHLDRGGRKDPDQRKDPGDLLQWSSTALR